MQTLLQDLRYGLRMLAKSPVFTAIAVLTLALGIGANTAIFSLIDAVMLRSLPVNNPSQLAVLRWSARSAPKIRGYMIAGDCATDMRFGESNPSGCSFSEPMFREIEKAKIFSGAAAFANAGRLDLTGNGPASIIDGQIVSGDFFRVLGIKAAAGRVLQQTDDSPPASAVAVLNYGYWQSAFGGSRDVIGRTIQLNNIPFTIVGVAEPRFTGITPGSSYDVWIPLADGSRVSNPARWQNRQDEPVFWWLTIVGRLKPEMPLSQAQAAISGIFANEMLHGSVPIFESGRAMRSPHGPLAESARKQVLTGPPPAGAVDKQFATIPPPLPPPTKAAPAQVPDATTSHTMTLSAPGDEPAVTLLSAQTGLTGDRTEYANPLYVLMLAVGIILLIACANVAGLILARSASRRREMAVRLALGAGRIRIFRQLLTESVLLSALGGAFGIFFAYWGAHLIVAFVSSNQTRPLAFTLGVDMRILAFTMAVSLITGVLFGIAPAFRSARIDLTPALKEGFGVSPSVTRAAGRWLSAGNALVVAQVALAIVVLVGAGLLVRTLKNLRTIDVGFNSQNVIIFDIDPTLAGYKDAQIDSLYRDLQGRLAGTPGVNSVSYSSVPLLSGALMSRGFHWPGTPQDRRSDANFLYVGPDFFHTMQIPLLRGRTFHASDYALAASNSGSASTSAPSPVIVNKAFVEKYLGAEEPVGKQFGESAGDERSPKTAGYEIVGVVRDTKYNDLRSEIAATMYSPQVSMGASFEVRTSADPQALLPSIRLAVAQLNSNLPLFRVATESQQIDRLLFQERLIAHLSAFFGLLALVLACVGLYGLLSYEVSRRTREIGIRMALGAQERDVLSLVVKQGLALAFVGAVAGIAVALAVTRYLTSMLYGVQANDPLTIASVAALLCLVALAACYIPARRATRVDPLVALRYE
jgi:predicted permease